MGNRIYKMLGARRIGSTRGELRGGQDLQEASYAGIGVFILYIDAPTMACTEARASSR